METSDPIQSLRSQRLDTAKVPAGDMEKLWFLFRDIHAGNPTSPREVIAHTIFYLFVLHTLHYFAGFPTWVILLLAGACAAHLHKRLKTLKDQARKTRAYEDQLQLAIKRYRKTQQ